MVNILSIFSSSCHLEKPSKPKCWKEGQMSEGKEIALQCNSVSGTTPIIYTWQRIDEEGKTGPLPPMAHISKSLLLQIHPIHPSKSIVVIGHDRMLEANKAEKCAGCFSQHLCTSLNTSSNRVSLFHDQLLEGSPLWLPNTKSERT